MLMPKKKKSDNWQHDCPKNKRATLLPREERRKKEKMQLKLRVFV